MSSSVIELDNLVKYYEGRCVLDGINLKVPSGCIYGLLGMNGSGKTTIIRILLGLEPPTRGGTLLFGSPSDGLTAAARGRIGYVAEGHNLIGSYKVSRLADLYKGLSPRWNDEFFRHLLDTFRLPIDRKVRQLSMGMRAQLNLALAMATEPELLILDDPTLGLDTVVRRKFLELAVDLLARDGRTILFSSHILSDVERIADRIGILSAGKLIVDCPLDDLKQRVRKLRMIFSGQAPQQLHMTDIINSRAEGRELILTLANLNSQKQHFLETFGPESIEEIPMTLEDIFLECTRVDPSPVASF